MSIGGETLGLHLESLSSQRSSASPLASHPMSDAHLPTVRDSIWHLLSLPKHYIAQQLTLEELGPVADSLTEIAHALRRRLNPITSPIKSKEYAKRHDTVQIETCMTTLSRYTSLVSQEVVMTSDAPLEEVCESKFRLLDQAPSSAEGIHSSSSLAMLIRVRYEENKVIRRSFSLKLLSPDGWVDLWTLLTLQPDSNISHVHPDLTNSAIYMPAIETLHARASPPFCSVQTWVIALSLLLVDLIQKCQGSQISPIPFEDLIAVLFDSTTSQIAGFALPDPPQRKRSSELADELQSYQSQMKKALMATEDMS